ncbi:hypothetical protein AAF712_015709 [Marasmius tenuissimus]|uniref:Uncharacterized protein n=1 Tax=Marasmius tenuissimus TaxID=585030 RepID=A0ABR2Z8N4_9AGAR
MYSPSLGTFDKVTLSIDKRNLLLCRRTLPHVLNAYASTLRVPIPSAPDISSKRQRWKTPVNQECGVGQVSSQYMATVRDEDMIYAAQVEQSRGMECDSDANMQQDERMLCDEWDNEEDDLMDSEESHHEVGPTESALPLHPIPPRLELNESFAF